MSLPAVGVEFCDQVVTLVKAFWAAAYVPHPTACGGYLATGDDWVGRMYLPVQTDGRSGVLQVVDKLEDLQGGRQVRVYPGGFGEKEAEARKAAGGNLNFYEVYASVTEPFDRHGFLAGLATNDWLDDRMRFLEGLFTTLNVTRLKQVPNFTGRLAGAFTDAAVVEASFDPIELREKGVFWALLRFSYVLRV